MGRCCRSFWGYTVSAALSHSSRCLVTNYPISLTYKHYINWLFSHLGGLGLGEQSANLLDEGDVIGCFVNWKRFKSGLYRANRVFRLLENYDQMIVWDTR